MSPGPIRQVDLTYLPKDVHFVPYPKRSPLAKTEPEEPLLAPPVAPILLVEAPCGTGDAYMAATRDQSCLGDDPQPLPLLPEPSAAAATAINFEASNSSFAIDSINEDLLQDREGMPTRAQWKELVESYLDHLHPTKRGKALIDYETYCKVFKVLLAPDSKEIGNPQFRFWTRKMFKIVEEEEKLVVTSNGRPVAIKEHIYDIICISHAMSKHGGRDKTCKVAREHYTWIPKELIANFVKVCPTCKPRRTGPPDALALRTSYSVESLQNFGRLPTPDIAKEETSDANLANASGIYGLHPVGSYLARSENMGVFHSNIRQGVPALSLPTPVSTKTEIYALHSTDPFTASASPDSVGSLTLPRIQPRQLPPLMQYLSQDGSTSSPTRFGYNNSAVRSSVHDNFAIDPSLYGSTPASCSCSQSTCTVCSPHSSQGEVYESYGNALHLHLGPHSALASPHRHPTVSIPSSLSNSSIPYEVTAADNSLLSASTATTAPELPTPSTTMQTFMPFIQEDGNLPVHTHASASNQQLDEPVRGRAAVLSIETSGLGMCTPPIYSPRPLKAGDPVNALMKALEAQRASSSTCQLQD